MVIARAENKIPVNSIRRVLTSCIHIFSYNRETCRHMHRRRRPQCVCLIHLGDETNRILSQARGKTNFARAR